MENKKVKTKNTMKRGNGKFGKPERARRMDKSSATKKTGTEPKEKNTTAKTGGKVKGDPAVRKWVLCSTVHHQVPIGTCREVKMTKWPHNLLKYVWTPNNPLTTDQVIGISSMFTEKSPDVLGSISYMLEKISHNGGGNPPQIIPDKTSSGLVPNCDICQRLKYHDRKDKWVTLQSLGGTNVILSEPDAYLFCSNYKDSRKRRMVVFSSNHEGDMSDVIEICNKSKGTKNGIAKCHGVQMGVIGTAITQKPHPHYSKWSNRAALLDELKLNLVSYKPGSRVVDVPLPVEADEEKLYATTLTYQMLSSVNGVDGFQPPASVVEGVWVKSECEVFIRRFMCAHITLINDMHLNLKRGKLLVPGVLLDRVRMELSGFKELTLIEREFGGFSKNVVGVRLSHSISPYAPCYDRLNVGLMSTMIRRAWATSESDVVGTPEAFVPLTDEDLKKPWVGLRSAQSGEGHTVVNKLQEVATWVKDTYSFDFKNVIEVGCGKDSHFLNSSGLPCIGISCEPESELRKEPPGVYMEYDVTKMVEVDWLKVKGVMWEDSEIDTLFISDLAVDKVDYRCETSEGYRDWTIRTNEVSCYGAVGIGHTRPAAAIVKYNLGNNGVTVESVKNAGNMIRKMANVGADEAEYGVVSVLKPPSSRPFNTEIFFVLVPTSEVDSMEDIAKRFILSLSAEYGTESRAIKEQLSTMAPTSVLISHPDQYLRSFLALAWYGTMVLEGDAYNWYLERGGGIKHHFTMADVQRESSRVVLRGAAPGLRTELLACSTLTMAPSKGGNKKGESYHATYARKRTKYPRTLMFQKAREHMIDMAKSVEGHVVYVTSLERREKLNGQLVTLEMVPKLISSGHKVTIVVYEKTLNYKPIYDWLSLLPIGTRVIGFGFLKCDEMWLPESIDNRTKLSKKRVPLSVKGNLQLFGHEDEMTFFSSEDFSSVLEEELSWNVFAESLGLFLDNEGLADMRNVMEKSFRVFDVEV
jgi:hypothetical protein